MPSGTSAAFSTCSGFGLGLAHPYTAEQISAYVTEPESTGMRNSPSYEARASLRPER